MFKPIKKEIREQIIFRVKNEGAPVSQVAEEHGISVKTIYSWLAREAEKIPSIIEVNRLKKENQRLYQIIGKLTTEIDRFKKGGLWQ